MIADVVSHVKSLALGGKSYQGNATWFSVQGVSPTTSHTGRLTPPEHETNCRTKKGQTNSKDRVRGCYS